MTDIQSVLAKDKVGRAAKRQATRRNQAFAGLRLTDLTLQRKTLRADITEAVREATITQSITEASSLTLSIHDKQRVLKNNDVLTRKLRLTLDERDFVTVGKGKDQDDYSLTGESRGVNLLRQKRGFKKLGRRGEITRAQAAKILVDEIPELTFYCPELTVRQKIAKADDQPSADKKAAERHPGLPQHAGLKVVTGDGDSSVATPSQLNVLERVLDACDGYPYRAVVACVEAAMIENGLSNSSVVNDGTSKGVFQAQVGISEGLNGRIVTDADAVDIEYMVACFMEDSPTGGFASKGGAVYIAKQHPDWSPGQIAAEVEAPAAQYRDRYAGAGEAAKAAIDAYGKGVFDGEGGGSVNITRKKPYEYLRGGRDNPKEDSWRCLQRLADEVRWYCFEVDYVVYFLSGDYLRRAKPIASIRETDDGIDWINWSSDEGLALAEATITGHSSEWFVPTGSVVEIYDEGEGVDGKWVINQIDCSLFASDVTVKLHRVVEPLPEPANDTESVSLGSSGLASLSGTLRERIVQVAEASRRNCLEVGSNPTRCPSDAGGKWYYCPTGAVGNEDPTRPPSNGRRVDCSLWVLNVYKYAGAPSPAGSSWTGFTGSMMETGHQIPMSQIKPGDLVIFGGGTGEHVELFVGPGNRTIGHGDEQVNYGTTDYRSDGRAWTYSFLDDRN